MTTPADAAAEQKRLERAAAARERYHSDPEYRQRKNAQARAYQKKHRKQIRVTKHRWYIAHREECLAKRRRQYARDKATSCTLTEEQWQFTLAWFCNRCVYCGGEPTLFDPLSIDHVDPLSLGGAHVIGNCAPAHRSCNSGKHNKPLEEWLAAHPELEGFSAEELRWQLRRCAEAWGMDFHSGDDPGTPLPEDGGGAAQAGPDCPAPEEKLGPPLDADWCTPSEEEAA